MGRYVIRRLLYMLVVIVVVSFITFGLMHAVPGGPFSREKALPEETIKILNQRYHLDDPLWRQYLDYLYNTMVPHITSVAPTTSPTSSPTAVPVAATATPSPTPMPGRARVSRCCRRSGRFL